MLEFASSASILLFCSVVATAFLWKLTVTQLI